MKKYIRDYWWGLVLGIALLIWLLFGRFNVEDLKSNIFAELFGILLTVVVVDILTKARLENEINQQLALQVESPDVGLALEALRILGIKGQLEKGIFSQKKIHHASLPKGVFYGADLSKTELSVSDFSGANFNSAILTSSILTDSIFPGATFHGAKLKNARIFVSLDNNFVFRDCQFVSADLTGAKIIESINSILEEDAHYQWVACAQLIGSLMPNGSKYDGRFNLYGDLNQAKASGIRHEDTKSMASFYEVELEEYLTGQRWFIENDTIDVKSIIENTQSVYSRLEPGTILDPRYIDPLSYL